MPRIRTAHKFSERQRTHDVLTDELVDFKSLLLSPDVLKGLNSSGFERPSPIQLKAIPLGRCGLDLIAQAKSGTGKTCVFSVIALESVLLDNNATQVLILAPTREIAVQIKEVITAIGSQMNNLVCHVFIGGLSVEDNKKILKKPCHIAVGTPGRIKFLIENHFLKTESVRLFILDEADKLLEDNFQEQINWIFSSLPSNKQMMAFSATYPEYLAKHLTQYMREPTFVRLNATDPTLQGIKQFHKLVPFHPLPHKTFQEKVSELLKVLSSLPFHQCLVFSNYQIRAQSLCDTLRLKGWPSVFIAGSQTQSQRLKAMEKLKEFKCRVLISTDLTSRGIDAEHVNLVVNMDVPRDSETYLHRIGRAGRFGTQGIAVTFVAQGEEDKLFKRMEENIGITIDELPDPIPQSLCTSEASSGLASKPVQPRAASVEVDILKNSSPRASGSEVNVPELDTIGNSASNSEVQKDYMGKTVCLEQQRGCVGDLTKQEPQKDTEIMQNQDELLLNLQIKGDLGLLSENTEVVTPVCPKRQSSEEETFVDPKQFQSPQNNSDGTLLLRKKTDNSRAVDSQDTSEVVLQCDLTKGSDFKVADKASSALASFAQNSFFSAEESENVLNKFQSLKLDSKRESRSVSKFDTCVERHGVQYKHAKNDAFYHKLTSPSADEKKLSEPQSREESSNSSCSENEDTCSDLESDDDDGDELKQWLPSVDEFERDFEEYLRNVSSADHRVQNAPKSNDVEGNRLENVSSVDHLVKSSPSSSEVGHELDSGCTQCECKQPGGARRDGSYIKTAGASASTHQLDVSSDTCSHHKLHSGFDVHTRNTSCQGTFAESCMSRQPLDAFPGTYKEMVHHGEHCREHYFQHQYQTKRCCTGLNEKPLSVRNTSSYFYPNGYNDKWYECGNSCNYRDDDNYDRNYTADWSASGQRQAYSASSQQYFDQAYNSVGCYQDYQWNMSWYNAYQLQTSFIRQFVSFSRTWRF